MEPQSNRHLEPEFLSLNMGEDDGSRPPVQKPINASFDAPESVRIIGDRYLIVNYVGAGTRGEIYEAIDQQTSKASKREQRVNIELFALRENQVSLVGRFASQFADLVNIPHPNIARNIDFGVDDQSVFFTMELLEGASLRSILDGNSTEAFTENEVMAVIGSTADALTHIHDNGFTHGNLTPDSIFITDNFDVKITDFASELLKQSFDIIAGRQTGSSRSLKPVEDVYGLAAIAYEMLAGEPAYDGISRTQARRKAEKLRPIKGLSRHRWKALSRALALRFDKRTPTVAEFVRNFGVTGDETLRTRASTEKSRSSRILKPLTALLAVAAVVAFMQPGFEIISEKFTDWQSGNSAPLAQIPAAVEPADVISTTDNEAVAEAVQVVEAGEDQSTLSAQVVESLEGEFAQYNARAEETDELVIDEVIAPVSATDIPDQQIAQTETAVATLESYPPQPDAETLPATTTVVERGANSEVVSATENVATSVATVTVVPDETIFARQSLTVNESQSMAAISILRNGNTAEKASIIWWTGENTARTDLDFAELGVRTETFAAGQKSMTVYVPIVSDSVREGTESFYVYAQSNLAPKNAVERLEVIVVDDDG